MQQRFLDLIATNKLDQYFKQKTTKFDTRTITPCIKYSNFQNMEINNEKALKNLKTGEIWKYDRLHFDHFEIYKNENDCRKGKRSRAVWWDGREKPLDS